MLGSKSAAGVGLPFVMRFLLDRYGFRTTIRAWAVASLALTAPLLYFLRPRIPPPSSTSPQRLSLSFLKLQSFWMLQPGNILQSLGHSLPTTYLAPYARAIGLDATTGTLMIALLNATSVPGSVLIGMLGDRFHVTTVVLVCTLGSALATLVFCDRVALLAVFAILYGFFAGGNSAMWSGVLMCVKEETSALETGLVFGLLAGGRSGSVVSGPLSTARACAGWLGWSLVNGDWRAERGLGRWAMRRSMDG
ncbi:hypothetical protein HO173_002868 [Letharia columbiana]|uniref:Major facilitator superfamily (MFS) profile domain-containing protein n=1 Tax=Letharia columbiana TaxID=112416 RepID=A0A8H6L832_9LECA|nr:uncharacterized protein HO173_002868 [Letharia columbiana]KAF6238996.1 hypothetical protein HO173_002868 [Letharia columbiana]